MRLFELGLIRNDRILGPCTGHYKPNPSSLGEGRNIATYNVLVDIVFESIEIHPKIMRLQKAVFFFF